MRNRIHKKSKKVSSTEILIAMTAPTLGEMTFHEKGLWFCGNSYGISHNSIGFFGIDLVDYSYTLDKYYM